MLEDLLLPEDKESFEASQKVEGIRRFLGLTFDQPASLLDYLPEDTLIAIDEPSQCFAHADRWVETIDDRWAETQESLEKHPDIKLPKQGLPKFHRRWSEALEEVEVFQRIELAEIAEDGVGLNLSSRPIPTIPHQFGKLADVLKAERDRKFSPWLISAQPSRSVALLQEHDCPRSIYSKPERLSRYRQAAKPAHSNCGEVLQDSLSLKALFCQRFALSLSLTANSLVSTPSQPLATFANVVAPLLSKLIPIS